VKKEAKKKPPRWIAVSIARIRRGGVDATKLAPGQPHPEVVVADAIDDRGRWFRLHPEGDLEPMPPPPAVDGDEA